MSEKAGRHGLSAALGRLWVLLGCLRYRLTGQRCFLEWDGVVWRVVED
mgnify:CR=1 FL=1